MSEGGIGTSGGCGYLSRQELDALLDEGSGARIGDERREAFERHLRAGCEPCALLDADLAVYRELLARGARASERAEASARAPFLERRLERALAARPKRRGSRRAVAAVVLAASLLVAALGLALVTRGPFRPDALIDLPGGGTQRVEALTLVRPPLLRGADVREEIWSAAASAYEGRDYAQAERLLARLDDAGPRAADVLLYRGVCLVLSERHADALPLLRRARERAEGAGLPLGAITWYEGLAHLAVGDLDSARESLSACRTFDGLFAEEADALLTRLEP